MCWVYEKYAILQYLAFQPMFSDQTAQIFREACIEFVSIYSRFVRIARKSEIDAYLQRSIIHAILHLPDTRDLYGTLLAVDCSAGEQRHRLQRMNVRNSNHKDIVRQAIRKVDISETLRGMREGVFDKTHPHMSRKLKKVESLVPLVFDKLAPPTLLDKASTLLDVTEAYV